MTCTVAPARAASSSRLAEPCAGPRRPVRHRPSRGVRLVVSDAQGGLTPSIIPVAGDPASECECGRPGVDQLGARAPGRRIAPSGRVGCSRGCASPASISAKPWAVTRFGWGKMGRFGRCAAAAPTFVVLGGASYPERPRMTLWRSALKLRSHTLEPHSLSLAAASCGFADATSRSFGQRASKRHDPVRVRTPGVVTVDRVRFGRDMLLHIGPKLLDEGRIDTGPPERHEESDFRSCRYSAFAPLSFTTTAQRAISDAM